MPTKFTKGDIFETNGLRAFAFGSNTDGSMDAGIAVAMKKRWPKLAEAYAAHCKSGTPQLGDVFVWSDDDITVFALAISQGTGAPRLTALSQALEKMFVLATEAKVERIGLPRIGAGKAKSGLDWTRVRKMLAEISVRRSLRLEVFEQFVRAPKSE
jgi:O-acetyl-ADP-ribose deacetylase (regulator of RNase III)